MRVNDLVSEMCDNKCIFLWQLATELCIARELLIAGSNIRPLPFGIPVSLVRPKIYGVFRISE